MIFNTEGTIILSQGGEFFTGFADAEMVGTSVFEYTLLHTDRPRLFSHYDAEVLSEFTVLHATGYTTPAIFQGVPIVHRLSQAVIAYRIYVRPTEALETPDPETETASA